MIEVYHGSTIRVEAPIANVCRDNLDFGKGFYITTFKPQATSWVERVATNADSDAYLNIYDFDIDTVKAQYRILTFTDYNDAWLNFISQSRHGECPWSISLLSTSTSTFAKRCLWTLKKKNDRQKKGESHVSSQ